MKYRKKPVVIEAWQFTKENFKEGAPNVFKHKDVILYSQFGGEVISGEIKTLEGTMEVSENDYIIKGIQGEFYPCKPDIFHKTYEKAERKGLGINENDMIDYIENKLILANVSLHSGLVEQVLDLQLEYMKEKGIAE